MVTIMGPNNTNKFIYVLRFDNYETDDLQSKSVVYYVGCTNDPQRRLNEHKRLCLDAKSPEYGTNKYRFIRELRAEDIRWWMDVVAEVDGTDDEIEDSEYAYVLQFADENEVCGIDFYGHPLTNMRAGDLLSEMLKEKFPRTEAGVKLYKERKAQRERDIQYERDLKTKSVDLFGSLFILPSPLTKQEMKEAAAKRKIVRDWNKKEKKAK